MWIVKAARREAITKSIRLNQYIGWNVQDFMQTPYHFQTEFAFSVQNFAGPAFQTKDSGKVILVVIQLFHPEFNGFHRIG